MPFKPDALPKSEGQTLQDFHSVFTHQVADPEVIQTLIQEGERTSQVRFESFQLFWEQIVEEQESLLAKEDVDRFQRCLSGGILLHLGGTITALSRLIMPEPMKGIIHVDRYAQAHPGTIPPSDPFTITNHQFAEVEPEQWWLQADLLDVVSHIPDNSVNIQMDGIDTVIVGSEAYHVRLSAELVRILRPGGIVFGFNSRAIDLLSRNPAVKLVRRFTERGAFHGANIYEKPVTSL